MNETGWSQTQLHLSNANNSAQISEPSNFIYFAEFVMGTKVNGPVIGVGPASGANSKLPNPDATITNDMVYNLAGNSAYNVPPRHSGGNDFLFADGHVPVDADNRGAAVDDAAAAPVTPAVAPSANPNSDWNGAWPSHRFPAGR